MASATRGTIVKGPRVDSSTHQVSTIGIVKTTQTTAGITGIVRTGIVRTSGSLGGGAARAA